MPRHTLFCDASSLSDAATLTITGEEAEHAVKSRRLQSGDTVSITDGRGSLVTARIDTARKASLDLTILDRAIAPRLTPELHIRTATPKGQRLDKMIDQLSQVGAASWAPLDTRLGVVDPGDKKLDRLHRIAIEAAKQCKRAWLIEIGASVSLDKALRLTPHTIIADAAAPPFAPTNAHAITLLVGPEGGFTDDELAQARASGAIAASFGPLTMRIETAAVAAASIIMLAATRPAS
jgi:16S rRNA (uracil1498-N3)-methyltransferase